MEPRNFRLPIREKSFYHIWNRGNNGENLFHTSKNYEHFIRLYDFYLDPVVDTFAFCLLPNHFHLLIYTKSFNRSENTEDNKMNPVSKAFQQLFTSYSQAINIQQHRTGSLFQKPFKRLLIEDVKYLANLVHYIHVNPQKHGVYSDFRNYAWSSYERIIRSRPSKLKRKEVINWFCNKEYYVDYHIHAPDLNVIKHLIIE